MTTTLHTLIAEASTLLDYDPLMGSLHWNTAISRKVRKGAAAGYTRHTDQRRVVGYKGHQLLCSKIIWYKMTGNHPENILHKNGDRNDLTFTNLLGVSRAMAELHYKSEHAQGVYFDKNTKRYRCFVQVNGKKQYFGSHDTQEQAAQARADGIKKLII